MVSLPALQCPITTTSTRVSSPSHTHTTTASFPALYSQGAGPALQSAAASEEQGQSIIQGDHKVANVRSTVCLIFQSAMPGVLYLDEQVADCCVGLHEAAQPTIISLEPTVCSMMLRSHARAPDLHAWLSSTCLFSAAHPVPYPTPPQQLVVMFSETLALKQYILRYFQICLSFRMIQGMGGCGVGVMRCNVCDSCN